MTLGDDLTDAERHAGEQFHTAFATWSRLLAHDGINIDGLEAIRRELLGTGWDRLRGHYRISRARMLDTVCRRLAEQSPYRSLDEFRTAGELIDPAPDDLSGLA